MATKKNGELYILVIIAVATVSFLFHYPFLWLLPTAITILIIFVYELIKFIKKTAPAFKKEGTSKK